MARKGRQFELLVTRIQRILAPEGAEVKSPDWITDSITGQRREIDAAIRYWHDGKPVLVNVECRDRKLIQDVIWIEQLATKRKDINASRTIAVSKSGFSTPAILKARSYNIDTFTIGSIEDEDIGSWLRPFPAIVVRHLWDIGSVNMEIYEEPGDNLELMVASLGAIPSDRTIFLDTATQAQLSIEDIVRTWQRNHHDKGDDIFEGVKDDDTQYEKRIRYNMLEGQMILEASDPRRHVRMLEIALVVERNRSQVPRSRRISYAGPGQVLIQGAEYDMPQIGKDHVVSFYRNLESGETRVSWSWDPADLRDPNKPARPPAAPKPKPRQA